MYERSKNIKPSKISNYTWLIMIKIRPNTYMSYVFLKKFFIGIQIRIILAYEIKWWNMS